MNKERVFVFRGKVKSDYERPLLYAFREGELKSIQSQSGSQNCYLVINGIEVQGSFDSFVQQLGERVDIK